MEKLEFIISFWGAGIVSLEQGVCDLNVATSLWLRLGWNRFFGKLVLQKAGVADEGGVKGRSGDVEAGIAVEEAEPDKISPEKSPERPEGGFGWRPARFFLKARFQIKIGEVVDLRDIAGNRGIRVVENIP